MPEKVIGRKNVVSAGGYELYSNLMGDINPNSLDGVKEINKEGLKNSYLDGRTSQFINRLGDLVEYVNLSGEVGKKFNLQTTSSIDTFNESGTFTVPENTLYIIVRAWGAGAGGGQGAGRSWSAAGGGGGGYSQSTINVSTGQEFDVIVGIGGQGGTQQTGGQNGGSSTFGDGLVVANGGSAPVGFDGGLGALPGVGDITYAGGDGFERPVSVSQFVGGGGGASAGDAGDGGNADENFGGETNGFGGNGGNGGSNTQAGQAGHFPGGAGGGKGGGGNILSGNGADGLIEVISIIEIRE